VAIEFAEEEMDKEEHPIVHGLLKKRIVVTLEQQVSTPKGRYYNAFLENLSVYLRSRLRIQNRFSKKRRWLFFIDRKYVFTLQLPISAKEL